MSDARKVDPYDVEALERAVNDSATRVSAIWISFLVFSLYLLIAATTVTQRQLLLAEPVKLPVLNIDLPLWGFFFLAPILFVILHVYVLLQVLLLGRTTAAYNTAVTRVDFSPEENASLRQRLANTLFAQIFAGSPREREGFIGTLLRAIVWITLAIGPILILLAFQFSFLAYHSHIATWTHRVLILFELAASLLIWPLALDAQTDFQWPKVGADLKRLISMPLRVLGPKEGRREGWLWLREQTIPLSACIAFILVSLSVATFPGEAHVNLFTGQPVLSVQCKRWLQRKIEGIDLRFDRLDLPQVDVVDDDKLANIEKHTFERKLRPSGGERTQNFRYRDFNCSDFSSADFRRVDLVGAFLIGADLSSAALDGALLDSAHLRGAWVLEAQLQGASLDSAQLQDAVLTSAQLDGASLRDAMLQGASFGGAQLQRAWLDGAQLQGASLDSAQLQGASLDSAQLQGASLDSAQLQGASLVGAQLQGASLRSARLQGASLVGARLQGASLVGAQLQGASLRSAQLQGASLVGAQLQGASLEGTGLQGTDLKNSPMGNSRLSGVYVWRAKGAACEDANVRAQKSHPVIEGPALTPPEAPSAPTEVPVVVKEIPIPATPTKIASYIERSVAGILEASGKERARTRMLAGLVVDPVADDTPQIEKTWSDCEAVTKDKSEAELDRKLAWFLRDLACDTRVNRKALAGGIVLNWISRDQDRRAFSAQLARGLFGLDGKVCAATNDLEDPTKQQLQAAIAAAPDAPPVTLPAPQGSPSK